MPLWNPYDVAAAIATHAALATVHQTPPKITQGTYTGDSSANKAIPHGLGVTPKLIIITDEGGFMFISFAATYFYYSMAAGTSGDSPAVTAPNTTNFYVGNAGSYDQSANSTGRAYRWAAIG